MRFSSLISLALIGLSLAAQKKKGPRDYTDADLERLYQQWEDADEDPLEEDELPEHQRKPKPMNMDNLNLDDPSSLLAASKKGKTLLMFVSVSGKPSRDEADALTQIWQSSLFNNHMEVTRYMIEDNRAIFMFNDGGQAWEAKNFIVQQERCDEVTLEGQVYKGKGNTKEEL